MSFFSIIEVVCIIIILFFQWKSFKATKQTINELKSIVPKQSECKIKTEVREVPTQHRFFYLDKFFTTHAIYYNTLRDYLKKEISVFIEGTINDELLQSNDTIPESQKEFYFSNRTSIDEAIQKKPPTKKEGFFSINYSERNETIDALNKYLEKNKGAVADFSLLRDITQRNIDVVDDEINLTLQSPLFLGLAGTMLGIIVGVLSLILSDTKTLLEDGGINSLLVSVMIAMVASFFGLILTTRNSAWNYKGVKIEVEKNKNRFFTFLQTELIPVLAENVTTGIIGLNKNIEKFGESFKKDVALLEGMINKNHESLVAQQQTIKALDDTNFKKIIGFNLDVFKELRGSMDALEKLSYSLKNVDNLVANSSEIVKRTQDVGNISARMGQLIDESHDLQVFLKSHFKELSDRGQIINDTVGKVDDVIGKSLNELKSHTEARIQAVKDIQLKEEDLLSSQLSNKREQEQKLKSMEAYVEEFKKFAVEESKNQRSILQALGNNNNLLAQVIQQNKSNNGSSQQVSTNRKQNPKGGNKQVHSERKVETIVEEEYPTNDSAEGTNRFKKMLGKIKALFGRKPKDGITQEQVADKVVMDNKEEPTQSNQENKDEA
ncbi:hypothetical protein EGI22_16050 [Lacihabitans sp. LS3-19]|uniref:hypothetical protein n=1 Tax=Lacihabitans sp. LS3-19 TaxID=2487335 RepID=UPI0020CF08CB|nr:hypothetical protein [Lacihabitans sp. LS3-19]MCP9769416.1 hypothetical protein [Lacihabitans sp. LS3-19]